MTRSTSQIVKHANYGKGIILKTRAAGLDLFVQFDSGLNRWLKKSSLSFPNEIAPKRKYSKQPIVPTPRPDLDIKEFKSRRIIEALRLGIVPSDCVEEFTFGRDAAIQEFKIWIEAKLNGPLHVIGGYGAGKTHLLNLFAQNAQKLGYASAIVATHPIDCPFSRPKMVTAGLIKSLAFKDPDSGKVLGFRDLVLKLKLMGAFKENHYFKHIYEIPEHHLWDWIECSESNKPGDLQWYHPEIYRKLPGILDHGTAANIYCYLLSSLSYAVTRYLSLSGLVLLFDESESLSTPENYRSFEQGSNFYKALTRTSMEEKRLLRRPHPSFGLTYSGLSRQVPFLYRRDSNLKLCFAFTEIDFIPSGTVMESNHIKLEHLSKFDLKKINRQLVKIYGRAYKDHEHELVSTGVLSNDMGTRMFVKRTIESLDIRRFS